MVGVARHISLIHRDTRNVERPSRKHPRSPEHKRTGQVHHVRLEIPDLLINPRQRNPNGQGINHR